jgi:hypothetical protein
VIITRPVINTPLAKDDVLGYFQADTENGLAHFPEDVDILGGRDSVLFDRKDIGTRFHGQGPALIPTAKFIAQVNAALRSSQKQQGYDFALLVVARDPYGIHSEITNVTFTLNYGGAVVAAPTVARVLPPQMTDMERLARDIALLVDREGSPAYLATYNRALGEAAACRSNPGDPNFLSNYQRLFNRARPHLAPINVPAFLDGVCDLWRSAVAEQAKVRASAEAVRNAVISANQSAEFQYEFKATSAWAARNLTLIIVGSAFGAFLMVCLVLAFLAMESHSNAMRDVLTALLEADRNKRRLDG